MVSNNGPPLPMPMQVPPGHMVQQIVDEHGILTHVILSPQPPGMPNQPMTVGYYVCISCFSPFPADGLWNAGICQAALCMSLVWTSCWLLADMFY